jgi:hypothetical protein
MIGAAAAEAALPNEIPGGAEGGVAGESAGELIGDSGGPYATTFGVVSTLSDANFAANDGSLTGAADAVTTAAGEENALLLEIAFWGAAKQPQNKNSNSMEFNRYTNNRRSNK